MAKQKTITISFLIFTIIFFIISCTTTPYNIPFDPRNPYPGKEILRFPNSQTYLFRNNESNKLIIILEGSGWTSVLGEKQDDIWITVKLGSQFLQELRDYYSILIPEKLNRQPGANHIDDMEDRANYTAENLLIGYLESINGFLANNHYSSIVLIGASESAALLPLVYERMINKDNVIAMVSIAFGGLSWYESFEVLSREPGLPQEFTDMYNDHLTLFNPENNEFPDCYEIDYYGLTKRYYKSFMHIRPFDYYKNINIPILFIHGIRDFNLPVESTIYIQENLPDKPFEFRYFHNWDHQPRELNDIIQFRRLIADWILML